MEELRGDLKVARDFKPMSDAEKAQVLAMAEPEAGDGRYEHFKSTRLYDAPIYQEMHGFPPMRG